MQGEKRRSRCVICKETIIRTNRCILRDEVKDLCPDCRKKFFIERLIGPLRKERVILNSIVPLECEEYVWRRLKGEEWVKTTCFGCNQGCDAIVKVVQGEIKEIHGDPRLLEDPNPIMSNGGKLCVKGLSEIDRFYHKDRLTHPLRRKPGTKRGEGKWERLSWDDALDIVSGKIKEYALKYGKESILFSSGTNRGWPELFDRFVNAFGSFRIGPGLAQCFLPRLTAGKITFGGVAMECPDIERSRTILVWGVNPPATWPKKARSIMKAWARGAKLIVVDPCLSETASKADLWLKIRPGTDSALALGMINVIIEEGLWDKEFVKKWCVGFDQLKARASDYPLDKVSNITWVPADKIREAAIAYAVNTQSSLVECLAIEQNADTISTCRALAILIAITGNVDIPGGNVFPVHCGIVKTPEDVRLSKLFREENYKKIPGNKEYPLLSGEESFKYGLTPIAHNASVWKVLLEGKPFKIRMLYNQGSNILRSQPNTNKVKKAISNLEFIVDVDHFLTETGMLADVVLPAGTWLERASVHQDIQVSYNSVHLQEKVASFGEAWSDVKIIIELAKRLGLSEYFFNDEEEFLHWKAGVHGLSLDDIRKNGGIITKPMEYFKFEKTGFKTPSGKIELYSKVLEEIGLDPLPGYIEPAESPLSSPELAKEYPYILTTGGRSPLFRHTELRQIERLIKKLPYPPAVMHPDLAARYGISNGDKVTAVSPRGKVHAVAEVTLGTDPRVIQIPHGWAGDMNVNNLTDDTHCAPGIGSAQLRGLLCNIIKGWV